MPCSFDGTGKERRCAFTEEEGRSRPPARLEESLTLLYKRVFKSRLLQAVREACSRERVQNSARTVKEVEILALLECDAYYEFI